MPDTDCCVRDKDKTYCWDDEDGAVVEYTVRKISLTECPEHIAVALMRRMKDKGLGGRHTPPNL
jgi:hypothetical protein